jgi:hypothetical protein
VTVPPAIDYTDKDFRSLRAAMLRLAQQRLPEWTDQSPADLGMLLVDLFAYMGDIAFYYQDRIASDLFPSTAVEPRSVVDLLRLIGYELTPVTPAMADLLLTFDPPAGPTTVTIPHGATFASRSTAGPAVEFCYVGPALAVDLASSRLRADSAGGDPVLQFDGLPVVQSTPVGSAPVGSSTGEPNQVFSLPGTGIVSDTVELLVDEGAGPVRWDRRGSLLFDIAPDGRAQLSHPDARLYQLLVDAEGTTWVVFGDGRRPPAGTNNITASFRVSAGNAGNLAAGTIVDIKTPIPSLRSVLNPHEAAGGSDLERTEHAMRYAPLAYRSLDRAVTESDYVALAQQTGTVAKVRATSRAWNQIDLHVAPAGPSWRPVPEAQRLWLLAYFEDKRMAGTLVRILDADAVPIDIAVDLSVDGRFTFDAVVSQAEVAIGALLAFADVDFGQTLFASDVYAAAEAVPGVSGVVVNRFRRRDQEASSIEVELERYNLPAIGELPELLRRAISSEVPGDGRIELGDYEIPILGTLEIATRVGPPE